jgi:protein TonB
MTNTTKTAVSAAALLALVGGALAVPKPASALSGPKPTCLPNADAAFSEPIFADMPQIARDMHLSGETKLALAIDDGGYVTSVSVRKSSGFAVLDDAAIKAVRSARFTPAMHSCETVASEGGVTVEF